MRAGLLAGGVLLAAAAACSGTGPLDALRFACRSSDECVAPYACLEDECTPPAHGGTGDAGTCSNPPGPELCGDGLDNDCDGLTDCADADCTQQPCSQANPAGACCGAVCVDLSASTEHCGSCGKACQAGQSCEPVWRGPHLSGRCT